MGFTSQLLPGELVIDTDKIHDSGDPDAHDETRCPEGFSKGLELFRRDVGFGAMFGVPEFDADAIPLIPESEWEARIKEQEAREMSIMHHSIRDGLPCKDQNGTNYCWANAPTHCVEITRMIQREPMILLSPASIANPIKGGRNQGGWGGEALQYIIKYGLAPADMYPVNNLGTRLLNDAAINAVRSQFQVQEWFELKPRNLQQLISCVLQNKPVAIGLNWWSHEVSAVGAVWLDGKVALRIRNSWGMGWGDKGFSVLQGSKMLPDDAVVPLTATPGSKPGFKGDMADLAALATAG